MVKNDDTSDILMKSTKQNNEFYFLITKTIYVKASSFRRNSPTSA
jgi:hypothetical protein